MLVFYFVLLLNHEIIYNSLNLILYLLILSFLQTFSSGINFTLPINLIFSISCFIKYSATLYGYRGYEECELHTLLH